MAVDAGGVAHPSCVRCGYSLVGMAADGRCPECGLELAAQAAVEPKHLVAWRRVLRMLFVVEVVGTLVSIVLSIVLSGGPASIRGMHLWWAVYLLHGALRAVSVFWCTGAPVAGLEADRRRALRHAVRYAVCLTCVAFTAYWASLAVGVIWQPPEWTYVLLFAGYILLMTAYIRAVSTDLGRRRTAVFSKVLFWFLAATTAAVVVTALLLSPGTGAASGPPAIASIASCSWSLGWPVFLVLVLCASGRPAAGTDARVLPVARSVEHVPPRVCQVIAEPTRADGGE